jgi:hypothetical protein
MRDVPPYLSEHPEDLYDALQVEFNKAMVIEQDEQDEQEQNEEDKMEE